MYVCLGSSACELSGGSRVLFCFGGCRADARKAKTTSMCEESAARECQVSRARPFPLRMAGVPWGRNLVCEEAPIDASRRNKQQKKCVSFQDFDQQGGSGPSVDKDVLDCSSFVDSSPHPLQTNFLYGKEGQCGR